MFRLSLIVLVLCGYVAAQQVRDPKEFCFRCKNRRNQKDYYANPADCTTYFHCFFFGNGEVDGVLQACPPGLRFDEQILTCVKMIGGLCTDPCQTSSVQQLGFWSEQNDCGTYYQCSEYHSVEQCCPKKEAWDQTQLRCVLSEECVSSCLPEVPITIRMETPQAIGDNRCKDQYDVTYQTNPTDNTKFFVVSADGSLVAFDCGLGSFFELSTCKCSGRTPTAVPHTQLPELILNITCDAKILDHSPHHLYVDNRGSTKVISTEDEVCEFGGQAWLEVPGFQVITLGDKVTIAFCVKVVCTEGNPTQGIISNRGGPNNDELSILFQTNSQGQLVANLVTEVSGSLAVSAGLTCGQYTHVTLQYDGATARLLINGQVLDSAAGTGRVAWMKHCPMAAGHDQLAGFMDGFLDNFLIWRKVLPPIEVIQSQTAQCLSKNQ